MCKHCGGYQYQQLFIFSCHSSTVSAKTMALRLGFGLFLVAMTTVGHVTSCPSECECVDENNVFVATCEDIKDINIDFTQPDQRDFKLIVRNSKLGDLNSGALNTLAGNVISVVTLQFESTSIGTLSSGSLDIDGTSVRLEMDFYDVTIDRIATGAATSIGAGLKTMRFTDCTIEMIEANAIQAIRISTMEWDHVEVHEMSDVAFGESYISAMTLNHVTLETGRAFTDMDGIERLVLTNCNFPTFPHNFIPRTFAPASDDQRALVMQHNEFHQVEQDSFKADNEEAYSHLEDDQFKHNEVNCNKQMTWLTDDGSRPSYMPRSFYESLVCDAPEELCGVRISTCEDGLQNCEVFPEYACDATANLVSIILMACGLIITINFNIAQN